MPPKPRHPCRHPGCPNLTTERFCDIHKGDRDAYRGSATARGYGSKWQRASKLYLRSHPLCVRHLERGEPVPATVVDHIKPHRGDKTLFWDKRNWQPLCKQCHDIKTATEDGGFGRRIEW